MIACIGPMSCDDRFDRCPSAHFDLQPHKVNILAVQNFLATAFSGFLRGQLQLDDSAHSRCDERYQIHRVLTKTVCLERVASYIPRDSNHKFKVDKKTSIFSKTP